jgi:polyisoprenoid-binding protein YceI
VVAGFIGNYESYNPRRKFAPVLMAIFFLGMLIGGIIGGVGGVLVFIRITGANDQPSAPISAPTLSLDTLDPSVQAQDEMPIRAEITATPVQAALSSPTEVILTPTTTTPSEVSRQVFRIAPEESLARFSVDETIPAGTAIGTTNQIAGDFIIDFANPSNSQLGVIRINLRTLRTDDPARDNSIRCCVLMTAQNAYEFTEFIPTAISGLPGQVSIGQTVDFQVTGNLTLRGVTQPVTFSVNLSLESQQIIRGIAQAIVNRSDFGILDDEMLAYHGVAQQVTLDFNFVARAVPG